MNNLSLILKQSAERFPRKKAVVFGPHRITFRELDTEVQAFAYSLKDNAGVRKGDRVAVLLNNSLEAFVAYYGILRAGGIIVSCNTFLKTRELSYILNDCGATVLVTSFDFSDAVPELKKEVASLKHIFMLRSSDEQHRGFRPQSLIESQPVPDVTPDTQPDDTAVLIYTSGTTGSPKGAMLTHRNLLSNIEASAMTIEVTSEDRFILMLPMFHTFCMTVCIFMPIYAGATVAILPSIRPFNRLLNTLAKERITIFTAIPQVYTAFMHKDFPWWAKIFLNLRLCVSGAAPLPQATLEKFEKKFGIPLLEGYGLSETSPVVSINPLRGMRKPGSVGLPIPNVEIGIFDDDGIALKVGEVGEIGVRGPNVMKGYYNLPEATKEVMREKWLLTGDIGKIDDEGYLYILERKKDMILSRGINIYPREIEEVLYTHPGIAEAAVIGQSDEMRGEIPVAVLSPREGATIQPRDIIRFCQERLASYKVPRKVEIMDTLPRNASGKILKRALKERFSSRKLPEDIHLEAN